MAAPPGWWSREAGSRLPCRESLLAQSVASSPKTLTPQSLKTWRRFQPATGKHRLVLVSAAQEVSPAAPTWSSPHWAAASVQSLPAARRLS